MLDPYVTVDEVSQNMQFMRDMRLSGDEKRTMVQAFTRLKLFEGTPIADKLREDGLVREDGIDLDYQFKDRSSESCSKCSNRLAHAPMP